METVREGQVQVVAPPAPSVAAGALVTFGPAFSAAAVVALSSGSAGPAGWPVWAWLVAVVVMWSPLPVSVPSVVLADWHDWVGGGRPGFLVGHWLRLLGTPAGPVALLSLVGWAAASGWLLWAGMLAAS